MKRTKVLLVLLAPCFAFQSPQKAPLNDRISVDRLRPVLEFLASDELRGRLTAMPGNASAAAYVRSRFAAAALEPAADGSYFQSFDLSTATLGSDNRIEASEEDNLEIRYRPGADFFPLRFSMSGRARGQLAFAGFGIRAPGFSHDDYSSGAAQGRIVLVFDHEPGENDPESLFEGVVRSEAARDIRKALFAQEAGAVGILFVRDIGNHANHEDFLKEFDRYWPAEQRRIPRYTLARWVERVRIPTARISTRLASILIKAGGQDLKQLFEQADSKGGSGIIPLASPTIELTSDVRRHTTTVRNVLAMLEGSDPVLKDEWVVVSAHFDHDGADGSDIFNGADDDASGTVGLIEIAETFAKAAAEGNRPRRSILFAAWNAEEQGLLGAWDWATAPPFELRKIAAVLNMDMIGRNEEVPEGGGRRFRGLEVQSAESNSNAINIMGYSRSPDLRASVERANEGIGLQLRFRYDNNSSNLLRRSDQWPFLQHGVPALFFHTGLHPDYHTPRDTVEKINFPKMEKIVRLVHQMAWDLAQADGRPEFTGRVWDRPSGGQN